MLSNLKKILRENEEKQITNDLTAKPDSMEKAAETVIGDDIEVNDANKDMIDDMIDKLPTTEPGEDPIDPDTLVEGIAKSYISKF